MPPGVHYVKTHRGAFANPAGMLTVRQTVNSNVHEPAPASSWQPPFPFHFVKKGSKNMESIQKLTPEIIEACIDREEVEVLGRTDEDIRSSDVWEEMQVFAKCVLSSEKLRYGLFGIANALYADRASSSDTGDIMMKSLQEALKSGRVTEQKWRFSYRCAASSSFWVGMHVALLKRLNN